VKSANAFLCIMIGTLESQPHKLNAIATNKEKRNYGKCKIYCNLVFDAVA
jgi:hypothetical protein